MSENNQAENRLSKETSPYLLQHKNNPVHWYPWCEEALNKAKQEKKPIFLSIGYSSCHWCHVMAHESFEDKETADIMNEHFINIKVDREERPDIDEIYLESVMLMTKHGGWPLSVFLTPNLKPFYGGTYFPLEARHGHPSFKDVLTSIANFFNENSTEVEERAEKISEYLKETAYASSLLALEESMSDKSITVNKVVEKLIPVYDKLLESLYNDADKNNGGFGTAPKFPQPPKISALLFSKNKKHTAHSILTLDKIRCGGIMDQIGGGMARYSVDAIWQLPHFEKMLYDNAQIFSLYAQASSIISHENPILSKELSNTAKDIFNYMEQDLKCDKTSLYFSAEDADSEGEEGLFYTFFYDDFLELFDNDYELKDFSERYFKVTKSGNFDGTNILTIPNDFQKFCKEFSITTQEGINMKTKAKNIIFRERNKKIRPSLDNKCLLSWNALAATSIIQSSIALCDNQLFERGINLIQNIFKYFKDENEFKHIYCNGVAKIDAFVDDLGFLLESCTEALLITGSKALLKEILEIVKKIHRDFIDPKTGTLFYSKSKDDIFNRPTKPEDNVIYSAHSAIFGSITKIRTWLESCAKSDILSASENKMLDALSLIAVSNTVTLSEKIPTACAQMLQKIKWLETKNTIIINEKQDYPATLESFHKAYSTCIKNINGYFILGSIINSNHELSHLHQYCKDISCKANDTVFSFCNTNGCKLPTKNLSDVFKQ